MIFLVRVLIFFVVFGQFYCKDRGVIEREQHSHSHSHYSKYEFRRRDHHIDSKYMKSIVMGKSIYPDFMGNHYLFFVYDPAIDLSVSKAMLTTGGMWEKMLNLLYKSVLEEERKTDPKFQPHVIDVGVNFGAFTLFASSMGSRVYGFDIQSPLLTLVDMGLRVNDYKHGTKLHNMAVWDRAGLNFSFTPELYNFGGTTAKAITKEVNKVDEFQISSIRLDTVLSTYNMKDIFFIKLDCEGCEPMALLGMDEWILSQRVRHVVVEIWGDPYLLEIFYVLGYTCQVFDDKADCSYPHMEKQCAMPTFAKARETFEQRKPYEHWGAYMDVHCWLERDPRFDSGVPVPPPILLDNLRAKVGAEGRLIRLKNEKDKTEKGASNDVYRVRDGRKIFAALYSELTPTSRKEVMDLGYTEYFLFQTVVLGADSKIS